VGTVEIVGIGTVPVLGAVVGVVGAEVVGGVADVVLVVVEVDPSAARAAPAGPRTIAAHTIDANTPRRAGKSGVRCQFIRRTDSVSAPFGEY
jgi:hypothetical protein